MKKTIKTKEKTAIFIDGDYMYHSTKRFNIKVNFSAFYDLLNETFGESIIFYYSSISPESKYHKSHQSFLSRLSNFGYNVKTFKLHKIKKTEQYISKIDIQLTIDALSISKEYGGIVLISGDSDFVPLFKSIKKDGGEVILFGLPRSTSLHLKREANRFYDLRKFLSLMNISDLSKKIKPIMKIQSVPKEIYIKKEKKFEEILNETKQRLKELNQMIRDKKTERELHKFIKDKDLIPNAMHEFGILTQNRNDFLLENEFGEFELWELKSPSEDMFEIDDEKIKDSKRYNKLKGLHKTENLVKAIEQISIYKKELIDENRTHKDKDDRVDEHIYNAKLILVYGSSDEFDNNLEIYLEKLNLERYMLNNMTLVTWEMFFEKIKSFWGAFLED